jgi:DNA-binding response OmpR family regulator
MSVPDEGIFSMNAKILVADESPTIHKIVAMAFENEGITVEGVSRGEHAFKYMEEFQPDIVLADIHLPGIDGYELCQQIKNSPSFGSVRVILLTSDFEDIDKAELENSRADDFISKPFKTEEILKKVKSQLKTPEPEKEVSAKKVESPQTPENNEVVQNEFEDIINQSKESTADSVKQLFPEDEETKPSINEIDLETGTPANAEESLEEKSPTAESTGEDKAPLQEAPKKNKMSPEILLDLPEEAFRAETRPVKVNMDDLNSAFQSVLSPRRSGPEDAPKRKSSSKPNLIEETLSFMTHQHSGEEFEIIPTLEPMTGETLQPSRNSADHSLDTKILKEHVDQVMDQIPEDARHGSSHAALEKTVRELLGEVAPNIIRQVIREEIENIKKTKEG